MFGSRPAQEKGSHSFPHREAVLSRYPNSRLGPLPGLLDLATMLVKHRRIRQGHHGSVWVTELLRQRQCFAYLLHGLLRVTEQPRRGRSQKPTAHTGVVSAIKNAIRSVQLLLIKRGALLRVLPAGHNFAAKHRGLPLRVMGLQKKRCVLRTPRQEKELICQVPCLFEVSLYRMNEPDSPQHGEELSGISDPLAQLPRPRIYLPRLCRPEAS